jgi:uncharacterized protein YeaO (DUF488 family)
MSLFIKRVYEMPDRNDGKRILIDRLWPRGLSKQDAEIDLWLKEIAPSSELRQWFGHEPQKWEEFRRRYKKELEENEQVQELVRLAKQEDLTLLYAAKDEKHNNAVVLREFLESGGRDSSFRINPSRH